MIEAHISQLMQDLELGVPSDKDTQGFYSIQLNEDILVYIKSLDPGMYFKSNIILCPTKDKETLFTLLLKANFLGLSTGGATIGLDKDEKYLTLSRAIPYDINYKSFKEIIEDFANYLDFWEQEVKRHQTAAEQGIL